MERKGACLDRCCVLGFLLRCLWWVTMTSKVLGGIAQEDRLTLKSGLGPLSALELYYGRKINPGWGICFLLTSQMIGYAFTGIYRDILVRPPKIYYPGGEERSLSR